MRNQVFAVIDRATGSLVLPLHKNEMWAFVHADELDGTDHTHKEFDRHVVVNLWAWSKGKVPIRPILPAPMTAGLAIV